jgi:hypothetical protein
MAAIEPVKIECPNCGSSDYLSFDENYDDEWITLLCNCLQCHAKFQINYRAVGIDIIGSNREEKELRRSLKNVLLDLLKRDIDLRVKYNDLIDSGCDPRKLDNFITYLLDTYSSSFADELLSAKKTKKKYLAYVIQALCAVEA